MARDHRPLPSGQRVSCDLGMAKSSGSTLDSGEKFEAQQRLARDFHDDSAYKKVK